MNGKRLTDESFLARYEIMANENKQLHKQNRDLVAALEGMFPYTECQCYPRSEYEGECLGCGYEAAGEKARQALCNCREGLDEVR